MMEREGRKAGECKELIFFYFGNREPTSPDSAGAWHHLPLTITEMRHSACWAGIDSVTGKRSTTWSKKGRNLRKAASLSRNSSSFFLNLNAALPGSVNRRFKRSWTKFGAHLQERKPKGLARHYSNHRAAFPPPPRAVHLPPSRHKKQKARLMGLNLVGGGGFFSKFARSVPAPTSGGRPRGAGGSGNGIMSASSRGPSNRYAVGFSILLGLYN